LPLTKIPLSLSEWSLGIAASVPRIFTAASEAALKPERKSKLRDAPRGWAQRDFRSAWKGGLAGGGKFEQLMAKHIDFGPILWL